MISTEEFIARLRRYQLFSGQQLEQLVVAARTIPPDALLKRLVESRWLSSWQATQLLHREPMLRIGAYILWNLEISRNGREIYSARHTGDQNLYVLKTWSTGYFQSLDEVEMVEQTARQVQQLPHPHLVRVVDVGRYRSLPFFAMDLVPGSDLQQMVHDNGPLPPTWACECIRQAALGLHHAALHRLTHGRLRPSKILVPSTDLNTPPQARVQGVGVSQAAANDHRGSTVTTGSPLPQGSDYMAPEWAVEPAKFAHASADIYSLGGILFYLLAGRLPFPGDTPLQIWNSRFNNIPLLQLRMIRPDLPSSIDVLLSRMLAYQPDGRFRSHEELAMAIRPFCGGMLPAELASAGGPARTSPQPPAPTAASTAPPPPKAAPQAGGAAPPGSGGTSAARTAAAVVGGPSGGGVVVTVLPPTNTGSRPPTSLPPTSGSGRISGSASGSGTQLKPKLLLNFSPQMTGEAWCELAVRVRLLSPQEAEALMAVVSPSGPIEPMVQRAVQVGWVTPWQMQELSTGRRVFQVGRYTLRELKSKAGNYEEYAAVDGDRFPATIKLVRGKHVADREQHRRLKREARLSTALDHPNLLGVLEWSTAGEESFLAVEAPQGPTLADVLKPQAGLSIAWACEVVRQAALGLHAAAQKRIVHRYLSPAAIYVGSANPAERPRVKVGGWGHAETVDRSLRGTTATDVDAIVGEADWMAPEQVASARKVDVRADVYALGSILFHAAAGLPPFAGPSVLDILDMKRKDAAPRLRWRRADAPAELEHLLAQMMDRDPALRPKSMQEVADKLAPFAIGFRAPSGRPEPARPAAVSNQPTSAAVEAFRATIAHSGLIPEERWKEVGESLPPLASARLAAEMLVHGGLLTTWQSEQLLQGRTDFRLGRFVLRDRLGGGGRTTTYLAEAAEESSSGAIGKSAAPLRSRRTLAALKVLKAEEGQDQASAARFHRAGRMAIELPHPNLAVVLETIDEGAQHYQVQEYLNGVDLGQWLADFHRLRIGWACEVIRQATLGLQFAHARDVVHRDLRPSKLMLVETEHPPQLSVKVLGLGDSYAADASRNGDLAEPSHYASPERSVDAARADPRSDVYSLGCTLYHLLTGRPPFEGGRTTAASGGAGEEPPLALREILPHAPAELEALLQAMTSADPAARPASAEAVSAALARFAQPLPPSLRDLRALSGQDLTTLLAEKGTHFLAALETHQVFDSKRLTDVRRRFSTVPEGRKIAQALIDEGLLSRWQARQLLSGRPRLVVAGKYRLEDVYLEGMRAVSYRGRDRLQRPIRVSLLDTPESDEALGKTPLNSAPSAAERLLDEGRLPVLLDHPHIASIIETGRDQEQWFICEDGQASLSLQKALEQTEPRPVDWCCECIRQAALALEHARRYDLHHLSLLPSDVDSGAADFAARPAVRVGRIGVMNIGSLLEHTVAGSRRAFPGPVDYVAPEQIDRAASADARTDVYSLGAILYALVCGQSPFPAESPLERLLARYTSLPALPSSLRPDAPAELEVLLLQALTVDPSERLQTPGDLAQALVPFCGRFAPSPVAASSPAGALAQGSGIGSTAGTSVASAREQWLAILQKSALLSPPQLAAVQQELAAGRPLDELGVWLVNDKAWITVWQWEQLSQGLLDFRIGKFLLLRCLGRGAAGAVYQARNPEGELIALKVLNEDRSEDHEGKERFLREGRVSLQLSHPNIAAVYAVMEEGRRHFMVMELVEGQDLKAWLAQSGPLPILWACECVRQAALGLQHAYEQGVVHRDVKPSNLMVEAKSLEDAPHVKILDMGVAFIARRDVQGPDLTRMGDVLGTPDYMAPEQAKDASQVDIRADIYSLGCTLFHLLTGYVPFDGDTPMAKLMARLRVDAPPIRRYRPDVPPELEAVVARMLARNPQRRYQTPKEAADALAPFSLSGPTAGPDDSESQLISFLTPEVEEFFAHLQRSTLLTDAALRDFRRLAVQMRTAAEAAQFCIEQNWITRWQSRQLLDGRNNFQFGNYLLLDLIGRGATGFVYKALDVQQNLVALKVLSAELIKRAEAVARFRREMRVVAALNHPNIVRSYDAGQLDEQTLYIAMEFVTGRDLKSWLNQIGALPVGWASECIRQAALGMQHAHEMGIVHRDIKPGNLLVQAESLDEVPVVKLLDLGFANATGNKEISNSQLTKHDQLLGTPDYMSPEQANDPTSVDIRSDVYSLGCTLFRLLSNRAPFLGATPIEKLNARFREEPTPIRQLRPEVPVELEAIILKMMARLPEHRFQLPRDVAAALEPFCMGRRREPQRTAVRPADRPALAAAERGAAQALPRSDSAVALSEPDPEASPQTSPSAKHANGAPYDANGDEPQPVRPPPSPHLGPARRPSFLLRVWNLLFGWAGLGVPTTPPTRPVYVPDGWKPFNLLSQIEPARHACEGRWNWTERGLRSPDVSYARVMVPGRVPMRYRLMVEVERFQGEAAFVVGLVVGGRQCFVTLDGWGGDFSGLGLIDGKPYNENPSTFRGQVLPEGRFVRLMFDVTVGSVELTVDGDLAMKWSGDPNRLGMAANWAVLDAGCLFIGSHSSVFNVRELLLFCPVAADSKRPGAG